MLKKQDVLNFPISLGSSDSFVDEILALARSKQSAYVCVAAVHQLIEAHQDASFAKISQGANIVTPDGMPITWALKILYGISQERIAGMDLLPALLKQAEKDSISVYFYGGTQSMLDKTNEYVSRHFPNLQIAGSYSPPFRALTAEEEVATASMINQTGAQLVFVVLGCPKQERWMYSMKGRIHATMVGIGAALPVLVGIQSRAPKWMQNNGLEWLYRLIQEPRRLWKRYFITNSKFIYLVTTAKFKRALKPTTSI
jgi:N-acetylglucosaminyldiphosphoundecaprenol N-acetyl-beta-D-mannosaminyltransferase